MRARVEAVEPMGSESYVYLDAGGTGFVSRVDAHQQSHVGRDAALPVFIDKAHFLGAESGASLD